MKGSYAPVKTIYKTFHILEILAERQPATASELVQELKLTRSNVHRVLATLREIGYVEKTSDSRYRLSFKIFRLGSSVPRRNNLCDIARPYLARLAEISGETVNLGIMFDNRVLYIDKIESPHHLKLDQPVGGSDPLHCTALGKVLLSGVTDLEFKIFLENNKLIPYTKRTITNQRVLRDVIHNVRKHGCATDLEELSDGIHCIAGPIFDHTDKVIAAISISAPSVRLTKRKILSLKAPLIGTSIQISRKMGCSNLVFISESKYKRELTERREGVLRS